MLSFRYTTGEQVPLSTSDTYRIEKYETQQTRSLQPQWQPESFFFDVDRFYSISIKRKLMTSQLKRESSRDKFLRLARKWREQTAHLSSATAMAMHPAYQEIIGMGPVALTFILEELRKRTDHWFWALRSITGANPVPLEDVGRVDRMARAWIQWGIDNRIIPE